MLTTEQTYKDCSEIESGKLKQFGDEKKITDCTE